VSILRERRGKNKDTSRQGRKREEQEQQAGAIERSRSSRQGHSKLET